MNKNLQRLALAGSFSFTSLGSPALTHCAQAMAAKADGAATITYKTDGPIQYVVGQITIDEPADRIWPVLANPYEFEEKISPRFKTVAVIADTKDESVLKCKVDVGFLLPAINYTVRSRYENSRRITFASIAGDFTDFRGSWTLTPTSARSCRVAYAIYAAPGIPVPQWLVRQAVKAELPRTLTGLRKRVEALCAGSDSPVRRTIAAAGSFM